MKLNTQVLETVCKVINTAAAENGDHVPIAGLGKTESHPNTYNAQYVLSCIDQVILNESAKKPWERTFVWSELCLSRSAWVSYADV